MVVRNVISAVQRTQKPTLLALTVFSSLIFLALLTLIGTPAPMLKDHDQPALRRIAVCMVGDRAEALLFDNVFENHKRTFLKEDVDLFVYLQVSNSTEDVEGQIVSRYKPWLKDYIIHPDSRMDDAIMAYFEKDRKIPKAARHGWQWGRRMFFKWAQCSALVHRAESNAQMYYDVVMRVRPDLKVLDPVDLNVVSDSNVLYVAGGNCSANPWEQKPDAIWDNIFMGSSKIMHRIFSAYYSLLELLPLSDVFHYYPESIFGFWSRTLELKTACHDFAYHVYRPPLFDKCMCQIPREFPVIRCPGGESFLSC
ncbi:hypothetical protein EDD86DRAFT_205000 [Gorgonomyces haynaldii]|nr:hypothetical protein EDD86DRAFT_205000 [Gorgonomyces haynaldii]